jgi:hypothetical protein
MPAETTKIYFIDIDPKELINVLVAENPELEECFDGCEKSMLFNEMFQKFVDKHHVYRPG